MGCRYQLEQEGETPVDDPGPAEIALALQTLRPFHRSFFVLSGPDGSYVQTAGARRRLTIEYRRVIADGYRHFVLGREEGSDEETYINCNVGPITVLKREVLTLDNARAVFLSFRDSGTVPPEYQLRDTTRLFTSEAQVD